MTALSSQELTDMRVVADDFFPDTCTIQTVTAAVGAMGGLSDSFANTYTGVACRLDPAGGGNETLVNEALEAESLWMLNIPYDQAISVTDRVIHSSITYEVRRVMDTHSYATIRRALLARVN